MEDLGDSCCVRHLKYSIHITYVQRESKCVCEKEKEGRRIGSMRDKTKRIDAIFRDILEILSALIFGMLKFNDIYKALFKKALPHWLLADRARASQKNKLASLNDLLI